MSNSCCSGKYLGCHKSGFPTAGTQTLTIPLSICVEELNQNDYLDFVIPCCFDYPETIGNVLLTINDATLFVLKNGTVKADQIVKDKVYRVRIGTEFHTATIVSCLPCTKFTYPTISTISTTYTASAVEPVVTLDFGKETK